MQTVRRDLTRTTLAIICLLVLIAGSLYVLQPFVAATVWATMLVVSTWPLFKSLQARFGGRRAPAVAVMTIGMLLLVLIPLWAVIDTLAGRAEDLRRVVESVRQTGLPQPPAWVADLPIVGKRISSTLTAWADAGPQGLEAKLRPYIADGLRWGISKAGSLGGTLVQFLLIVILAAVLYSGGETAATGVRRFGHRLAGERGDAVVILAGQAIRGVALGVGVTAAVQTVLGAIGLAIAGVPFVSVLAAVMAMLCIAQIGPGLVLAPAVAWMYWKGDSGWATFLLLWSLVVGTMDNFLRPILIKKGADLPLLLIFAGVVGGLLGFGLIGIFVGPVVLAVTYTLLGAWIDDGVMAEAVRLSHLPQAPVASADETAPPSG